MTLSIYQASVPVFTQLLSAHSAIIDKTAAHAAERRIDPAAFLQARLFPDMFPYVRQVQTATDHAKGATARLAGIAPPRFEDTEGSFDELKARIAKTLDFISGVPAESMDGAEDRDVTLKSSGGERVLSGRNYLFTFALPNFLFHMSTAYGILRHNGVDLGKKNFMTA